MSPLFAHTQMLNSVFRSENDYESYRLLLKMIPALREPLLQGQHHVVDMLATEVRLNSLSLLSYHLHLSRLCREIVSCILALLAFAPHLGLTICL